MIQIDCEEIGNTNRFGDIKTMNCLEYFISEHKEEFNPKFNDNDFCKECLKVLDWITRFFDALSELTMSLENADGTFENENFGEQR